MAESMHHPTSPSPRYGFSATRTDNLRKALPPMNRWALSCPQTLSRLLSKQKSLLRERIFASP